MTLIDKAEALATCPFCGGAAVAFSYITEGAVRCGECHAAITRGHKHTSETGYAEAIAAWNRRALPARGVGVPTDPRPANCRFRLKDDGKPYGRSSCSACDRSVFTGLGNSCHLAALDPTDYTLAPHLQKIVDGAKTAPQWDMQADRLAPTDAPDTDLLFDAYKGMLVLHRTLDRMGLARGSATASRIADKIVAAHPEFPARTALRHTEEPK